MRIALAKNGLPLTDEETNVLNDFFKHKYRSTEITKKAFTEMMETKFKREVDEKDAQKALVDVRNKLDQMHVSF